MISPDHIASLHAFIEGFFPAFDKPIHNMEIMSSNGGRDIHVSIRSDVSYDLTLKVDATLDLCCRWEISMGDPRWADALMHRFKKCIKMGDISNPDGSKRRGKFWDCSKCGYKGEW